MPITSKPSSVSLQLQYVNYMAAIRRQILLGVHFRPNQRRHTEGAAKWGKIGPSRFMFRNIFGRSPRLTARNHLVPEEHSSNWGGCWDLLKISKDSGWKAKKNYNFLSETLQETPRTHTCHVSVLQSIFLRHYESI